ncbi:urea transporter [Paludisphaera sp.]|uniref:urea transporter n=1 Tax=Paludisphaera sp. TaxID=2017432 RepID=UPI00301B791C
MAQVDTPITRTTEDFLAPARIALRGVGQIMFQGHAGTGLFFLAGIAMTSPAMLAGAVLGAVIGPLFAHLAGYDRRDVEQGLYGFNSTLVGLALPALLLPSHPLTWAADVVGCVLATIITRLGIRFLRFPAYTAPFVVSTWLLLLAIHGAMGHSIDAPAPPPAVEEGGFWAAVLRGESEVMLGANQMSGVLFLVGIAISNPWHAAMAFLGSLVGTTVGVYHGDPEADVSIGLFGYNGALAAIALFLPRPSLTLPLLAAVISTPLTEYFPKELGIPALTAPFVAASWIMLAALWAERRLFVARD